MKRLPFLLALCAACVVSVGPIGCAQMSMAFGLPAGQRLQDFRAMLDVALDAACRQGVLAQDDVAGLRESATETMLSYGSDDSEELLASARADLRALPAADRQTARRLIEVVRADAAYQRAAASRTGHATHNAEQAMRHAELAGTRLTDTATCELDSLDFVAPALPVQMSTELSLALVGLIVLVAVLLFLAFILNIG